MCDIIQKLWSHIWYHSYPFLALHDIDHKIWYHTWYHSFMTMISCFFMISCMISQKRTFSSLSCAIFLWYQPWYHTNIIWKLLWYQDYLISYTLITLYHIWYGVISAYDIKIIWYHSPMISPESLISRHLRGELGVPRARSSASSGLTAANELGTGVQLNGDGLDPAHGLAAVDRGCASNDGRLAAAAQVAFATWNFTESSSSWSTTLAVGLESESY